MGRYCGAMPELSSRHALMLAKVDDKELEAQKLAFLSKHLLQTAAPLATDFVLTQANPLSNELLTVVQVRVEWAISIR